MSRIGRVPISIPTGVKVAVRPGNEVIISGPKGELTDRFRPEIDIEIKDDLINVTRSGDEGRHRAFHGLTRSLLANMVTGVTEGYRRELEIQGVGYRALLEGSTLVLNVGFSHSVFIVPPEGIAFDLDRPGHVIGVTGIDKQLVGEITARIRRVRPPEPYKGKGIRYMGEYVRIKAGKAGKIGTGA